MSQYIIVVIFSVLLCYVLPNNAEVTLTQNVTNDSNNATVCPETTVVFTCISKNKTVIIWQDEISRGTMHSFSSDDNVGVPILDGGFTFLLINNSNDSFTSTATIIVNGKVTLSCSNEIDTSVITINIVELPPAVTALNIVQSCHDSVLLNWTSIGTLGSIKLNSYRLLISPPPNSGIYSSGQCFIHNTSVMIPGLQDGTEYTYAINGVNCVGNGSSAEIKERPVTKEPPEVTNLKSTKLSMTNNTAVIFVEWECPTDLSCTIPSITHYIVSVSGVTKNEFTVNGTCNATHTVPACGVSAVTVSAVNRIGTGDKSDPELIEGASLTLSVSTTIIEEDYVSLRVTVTECLRPAITNITITFRSSSANERIVTANYSSTTMSVDVVLSDLESSTVYNATVVLYYREGEGGVKFLTPQVLTFTTAQSFNAFIVAVIIGLSVGSAIGLVIISILLLFIFGFCYQLKQAKANSRKLRRDMESIKVRQIEIQQDIRDVKLTNMTVPKGEEIAKPKEEKRLYPNLQYNVENDVYMT